MTRARVIVVVVAALVAAVPGGGAGAVTPASVNIVAAPNPPSDGAPITFTASGTSPVSSYQVDANLDSGPGPCAADPSSDTAGVETLGFSGDDFTMLPASAQAGYHTPGAYTVCAWIVDPNTGEVVNTQSFPVTIASADTLAVAFGQLPVQGRAVDVVASGTNHDGAGVIEATVKPAGGACAATGASDSGRRLNGFDIAAGVGQYSRSVGATTQFAPGNDLLCGWLVDQGNPAIVLARTQTTFTVPRLHAAMTLHAPGTIAASTVKVTLNVALDGGVPVSAVVDLLSRAGKCADSPAGEPKSANDVIDEPLPDVSPPSGTASVSASVTFGTPGRHVLCAWLLDAWSNAVHPAVVAGPVSATVTVAGNEAFTGKTSQHLPISFATLPFARHILGIAFEVRFRCDGVPRYPSGHRWNGVAKESLSAFTYGVLSPDAHGRFALKLNGNRNHRIDIHGRVAGKTISGTITDRIASWIFTGNRRQQLSCRAGTERYTAHAP